MSETKKRALIVSDFTDAGTGKSFTKGDTPLIEAGAHGNYEAAGLVKAPPPAKAAAPAARLTRPSKSKSVPAKPAVPAPATKSDTGTAPTV